MRHYWHKCLVAILILPILTGLVLPSEPGRTGKALSAPGLVLIQADPQGLEFEFILPRYELSQASAAGQPCELIQVEGMKLQGAPGYPQLPAEGIMLGLPGLANVSVEILESEMETLAGPHDLCPATEPFAEFDPEGNPVSFGQRWARDEQVYASDQAFPANLIEFEPGGFIRSQRVGVLRIQPVQYIPATGELRLATKLKVRVSFNSPAGQLAQKLNPVPESGYFEAVLEDNLVNYEQARSWRVQPALPEAAPEALTQSLSSEASQPEYKIEVKEDGIYQITYDDLKDCWHSGRDTRCNRSIDLENFEYGQ